MSETSKLAEMIIDDRLKGLSYYAIEQKHGIPAMEAREMVREVIANTSIDDEWEMRGIAMLRLEKVIENLWLGVERGEFKHAEAMIKAIEQTSQLLDLNKKAIEEQRAAITDEQASIIYMIVTENNRQLLDYLNKEFKPNKRQQALLEEWPQITADASTQAIEAVLYEEDEE